ncbi:MAG: biosis protein MshQ [Verrucomicrobiota bacterium]
MKLNNQNRIPKTPIIRITAFLSLVCLFLIPGAPEALASVWKQNANFQCGQSGTIAYGDDGKTSCGPICPGTPIYIIYGIQYPSTTSAPAVTVTIPPLPSNFIAKPPQAIKLSNGGGAGTPLTTQPTLPTLATGYSIPAGTLTSSNDQVIIVIDGYFTQASSYPISFTANGGGVSEPTSLNINATCPSKPANLAIKKEVEALPGGSYGTSASVTYGTSVRYRITVTNTATPNANHSTDLYLGGLLQVSDYLSTSSSNDVPLDTTISNYQCTSSSGAASVACPSGSSNFTLPRGNGLQLPSSAGFTYPGGSNGSLPAGDSFTITFDVLIKSPATCSPSDKNSLANAASVNYMGGSLSSSSATVNVTGLAPKSTPCPTPVPTPALTVTKTITNPPTGGGIPPYLWGSTLTYQIQFTNPSTTSPVTGIKLYDQLYGNGTPAFTATFSPSSTNLICSPAACTNTSPTTTTSIGVGSNANAANPAYLFSTDIGSLGAGQTETVTYQVKYDAPCGDVNTSGDIQNRAVLGGTVTGVTAYIPARMPAVSLCALEVDKTETTGVTAFSSYPQNLSYHVVFKNNSPQPITVGTVVDSIIENSSGYGNLPIAYSYQCTVKPNGVSSSSPSVTIPTTASALTQSGATSVAGYNTSSTYGNQLLNFSGSTFQPGGYIDCTLNVTLKAPPTTDSLCEGNMKKHDFINAAYMNLTPGNYNKPPTMAPPSPQWYQDVTTPLPDCVSIIVQKAAPQTVTPGGAVTFTLTVTNTSTSPVSGVILHDIVPTTLTGPYTWSCQTGCTSVSPTSGTGDILATLTNLPAGGSITMTLKATAPDQIPATAICNTATATFTPGPLPPNTYFEGDQGPLTKAPACIQVVPADGTSPTPTPTPTPGATGCAKVADKDIHCLPNGDYSYTFDVTNNSGSPMSQVLLTPVSGSTFTLAPQLSNLPSPLANGQSTTVTVNIGKAKPGDKVCFFASLMADQTACCNIQVCTTLPNCNATTTSPTPTPTATATATASPTATATATASPTATATATATASPTATATATPASSSAPTDRRRP